MTEVSAAPLLKTDTLGRVKTPAARREQLLDEFEQSGASGKTFAELVGVKYQTFAAWVQQRKRRRAATTRRKTPAAKVRWLEAVVGQTADPSDGSSLSVHLPGGARLEISCARQIPLAVALVRELEKPCAAC
jgi:transposase-like protein